MLSTYVHEKLLVHLATKTILGQHALNGVLNDHFRTTLHDILGDGDLLATGIAGYRLIFLLIHLVTCEDHLFAVDHDDIVAAVNMWRIVGLVFAAQHVRNLAANPAHSLIGPVYNEPFALHGSCICMLCGEMKFTHKKI